MTLKAFEPKKLKFGKTDMNILAQTSSDATKHDKSRHHMTGQKFNPIAEKIFTTFGV